MQANPSQPSHPPFIVNNFYYGAPSATYPPFIAPEAVHPQHGTSISAYPQQVAGPQAPFGFYPAPFIAPFAYIDAEIEHLFATDYSVCERINQIRQNVFMYTDFLNRQTQDMHRAYDTWEQMGQSGAHENQRKLQWTTYSALHHEVESNAQRVADCNEELMHLEKRHHACITRIQALQQQRFAAMAGYQFPQQPVLPGTPSYVPSFPPSSNPAPAVSRAAAAEQKEQKLEKTITFGSFDPIPLEGSDGLKKSPKRKLGLSMSSEGVPNVDEFLPSDDDLHSSKKRTAPDRKPVVILSGPQPEADDSADAPLPSSTPAAATPSAPCSYASKAKSKPSAPVAALQPHSKLPGDEIAIVAAKAPTDAAYYNTENKKTDKTGLGEAYPINSLELASSRHIHKRLELFKKKCLIVHNNKDSLRDYTIVPPFKAHKYYSPVPFDTQSVGECQRAHISVIPQIRMQHIKESGDFEIQGKTISGTKKVAIENLLNVCDITEKVINIIDGIIEIKVRPFAIELLNAAAAPGAKIDVCASQFALAYDNALDILEQHIESANQYNNLSKIYNGAFAKEEYSAIKACIKGMRSAINP